MLESISFFFKYVVVLIEQYFVPFLFAIGFIFIIYGIVFYFIMGFESDKRAEGRLYFIKANVWFFFGLVTYLVLAFLVWTFTSIGGWFDANGESEVDGDGDGTTGLDVDLIEEKDVLPLPNVPTIN